MATSEDRLALFRPDPSQKASVGGYFAELQIEAGLDVDIEVRADLELKDDIVADDENSHSSRVPEATVETLSVAVLE